MTPKASIELSFPLTQPHAPEVSRSQLIQALNSAPQIYQIGGVTVAHVHKDGVLKYGCGVRLSEARTMQYVTSISTVRLPAVYDAWEDEILDNWKRPKRVGYIYMQYIKGDRVSDVWDSLETDARQNIYLQLADTIRTLRSISVGSPGPLGGDVSFGELFTDHGAGPFTSSEHLEAWFNERLLVCKQFGRVPQTEPEFSMRYSPLVICHLDIFPQNLILDPQGNVWLLDWAFAGGYPAYFEKAVLSHFRPKFSGGLLALIGNEGDEDVAKLRKITFALSIAAMTRPTGYPGLNIPGYYEDSTIFKT